MALSNVQNLSLRVKVEYLEDFRNLVVNILNLRHIEFTIKYLNLISLKEEAVWNGTCIYFYYKMFHYKGADLTDNLQQT